VSFLLHNRDVPETVSNIILSACTLKIFLRDKFGEIQNVCCEIVTLGSVLWFWVRLA
jgi:hypothetical protein